MQWDVGRQGCNLQGLIHEGGAVVIIWAGLREGLGLWGGAVRADLTLCAPPAALPAEMFTS